MRGGGRHNGGPGTPRFCCFLVSRWQCHVANLHPTTPLLKFFCPPYPDPGFFSSPPPPSWQRDERTIPFSNFIAFACFLRGRTARWYFQRSDHPLGVLSVVNINFCQSRKETSTLSVANLIYLQRLWNGKESKLSLLRFSRYVRTTVEVGGGETSLSLTNTSNYTSRNQWPITNFLFRPLNASRPRNKPNNFVD